MEADQRQLSAPLCRSLGSINIDGYRLTRNTVGESGASVFRLEGKEGAPDLFLRHGRHAIANDITQELARLTWLAGQMPVPDILHFVRTTDEAWLLTPAIPGRPAFELLESNPDQGLAIVDALAFFLRRWHALPANNCPFAAEHFVRLAQALKRIDAGLVDVGDFDNEREGWSAETLLRASSAAKLAAAISNIPMTTRATAPHFHPSRAMTFA